MSASCCAPARPSNDPRFRRALWMALVVNATMFFVEVAGSVRADSVALLADAIDFFGDAANYAISLAVLAAAVSTRAKAALVKAASMALFGVFVLAQAIFAFYSDSTPEPMTMGVVAIVALLANAGVAVMLYRFRTGDSNMRSVWICSRNDAVGNVAVALAALGVFGTGSNWPDLGVAVLMAVLAITGATSVVRQAREELRPVPSGQ